MRRTILVGVVLGLAVGLLPPAAAATRDVTILGVSGGFDPVTLTVDAGQTVRWTNTDGIQHTTAQDGPLALWSSGPLSRGQSFSVTLVAAGTYPYHCAIHPSQMRGTIRVPVVVTPAAGGTGTAFTVTVASARARDGFAYDVQRRMGSGRWTMWKRGITKPRVTFRPGTAGSYSFRSRLHHDPGGAGRWSPVATVSVTG
jgi:plastocyanin